jgi:hypothetical protein
MAEIIALIIALLCLMGDSSGAAIFFVVVAMAAGTWRAFKTRDAARHAETEIASLRSELQRITSLAERAIRIAAETANAVGSPRRESPAEPPVPAAHAKEELPVPPTVEKPKEEKRVPVEPPAAEIPEEAPQVVPEWAAHTRFTPPVAPKITESAAPTIPVKPIEPVVAPPPVAIPIPPATVSPKPYVPPPPPPRSTPRKSMGDRARSALALEEILGTNWLNKIGVIFVVLGVAFFGNLAFGTFSPAGKVGFVLGLAATLLGGGIYLERKERYKVLGRTGIGGGWALLFFTSYALNHVAAMRVMNSDVLDSILMLVVAAAMVGHTLRYRSQLVTGLSFLLAYSTIALSHDTVYSLAAGAILAAAIISIIIKLGWFELEVFAILSSYGNHFYWLYRLLGDRGAQGHPFPEFMASTSLLLFYWAAFRFSYVVRKIQSRAQENISTVAGILNIVFLLFVMKFQSARPELAFYALLALGAIEFTIGQLPITKRRRAAFVLLTLIGTALMLAAVPFRYSGENISILWLIGAEVLLFAGILTGERLFRRLGLITGLLVLGDVLLVEVPRMISGRGVELAAPLIPYGVLLFVMAVVFYANNTLLRLRWPQFFTDPLDDNLLTATSYPGAITLCFACWAAFTGDWLAVAFATAMLAVAVIGFWIKSKHLQVQFFGLGMLAARRSLTFNAHWESPAHSLNRMISLAAVSALFYATAKLAQHSEQPEQRLVRGIFAVFGTSLAAVLLFVEVPAAWQPIAFAAFAWVLIEAAQVTRYLALRWHTHIIAAAAYGLAATYDVAATPWWRVLHTGIWKLLPVVAVLYLLANRAGRAHQDVREWVRELYTWAGTTLAVWLIFESLENHYVAAAWVLFAVALTAVSRGIRWASLARQAFVLGALSAIQAAVVNLFESAPGAHNSVRLSVTLIVIVSLYVMSEALRLPESWRQKQFEALHSWLATSLAALLMWYELSPASIAVGWAVLGVALYEYGAFRKSAQFRWQAYLVLCGSFVRIFFANLTAGAAGDWMSTRTLTVLPIVAIYYFVYAREVETRRTSGFNPAQLFAHLGTAAVMALLYFQFAGEWVITAWAAVIMVLLAMALLLKQSVFVQQAVLVAVAVLGRGMLHNLFGGSYFTGSDWQGRFAVMGSAILLMFASLPLAFEYRKRSSVAPEAKGLRRLVETLTHRVEQPLFFVPVALLTTMLALKMDHGMVTLAWGVEAVLIFVAALLVKERSFRLTGVLLLLLCVVKIIAVDAWRLAPRDRYLTFIVLGASLLLVSFLYSKYRETIRQYL